MYIDNIYIPDSLIELKGIRSSGPGGQHVNKVSTGILLRYDINEGHLPEPVVSRLLQLYPGYITKQGILQITAHSYRSSHRNKEEAIQKFIDMVSTAAAIPKKRKPTRPTKESKERRIENKKRSGRVKELRKKPRLESDH